MCPPATESRLGFYSDDPTPCPLLSPFAICSTPFYVRPGFMAVFCKHLCLADLCLLYLEAAAAPALTQHWGLHRQAASLRQTFKAVKAKDKERILAWSRGK